MTREYKPVITHVSNKIEEIDESGDINIDDVVISEEFESVKNIHGKLKHPSLLNSYNATLPISIAFDVFNVLKNF